MEQLSKLEAAVLVRVIDSEVHYLGSVDRQEFIAAVAKLRALAGDLAPTEDD